MAFVGGQLRDDDGVVEVLGLLVGRIRHAGGRRELVDHVPDTVREAGEISEAVV